MLQEPEQLSTIELPGARLLADIAQQSSQGTSQGATSGRRAELKDKSQPEDQAA